MAGKEAYTVAQVIDALRATKGMKGPAARKLGCTWNTVDNYAKRHPTIAAAIAEEREMMLDIGELSLARAVQNGEAWAVCFLLKTQGKSRGYVERQEITGGDGGPVEVATEKREKSTAQEIREIEAHIAELEADILADPRG